MMLLCYSLINLPLQLASLLATFPFDMPHAKQIETSDWTQTCDKRGLELIIVCSGVLNKHGAYIMSQILCFLMAAIIFFLVVYFILRNTYHYKSLAYHIKIRQQKSQKAYNNILLASQILVIFLTFVFIIVMIIEIRSHQGNTGLWIDLFFTQGVFIIFTSLSTSQTLKNKHQINIANTKSIFGEKIFLKITKKQFFLKTSEEILEEIEDQLFLECYPSHMLQSRWDQILVDVNDVAEIKKNLEKQKLSDSKINSNSANTNILSSNNNNGNQSNDPVNNQGNNSNNNDDQGGENENKRSVAHRQSIELKQVDEVFEIEQIKIALENKPQHVQNLYPSFSTNLNIESKTSIHQQHEYIKV